MNENKLNLSPETREELEKLRAGSPPDFRLSPEVQEELIQIFQRLAEIIQKNIVPAVLKLMETPQFQAYIQEQERMENAKLN